MPVGVPDQSQFAVRTLNVFEAGSWFQIENSVIIFALCLHCVDWHKD